MYVDPELTVSAILSWLRDAGILVAIAVFGWKARGAFQEVSDFANLIRNHMVRMEAFVVDVKSNHLFHIEQYLYDIAKDRNQVSLINPGAAVVEERVLPPNVKP